MSAYLQMGHDSENLVGVPGLEQFTGLVLSPVNRTEADLRRYIGGFREKGVFDIILDPQLYFPQQERGQLATHPYFPTDLDTADLSSSRWWSGLVQRLADYAIRMQVDAVCSPAVVPKKWGPDYCMLCAETFASLVERLKGTVVRPVITVCVSLKELATVDDALRVASIATSRNPSHAYIVVDVELEPRREIIDSANLTALMALVAALEKAGCSTLVSHCSSDVILMKAAGASHVASGKYFNLRRFTRSRFEEEKEGGGGQLPYWFEHSLLAFLREADIARLRRNNLNDFIATDLSNNAFAAEILEQFVNKPGEPWLRLSWRQYLAWFAAAEKSLSSSNALQIASTWLRAAEERWELMEEKDVLLEEPKNNGRWIRPWRQALSDFRKLDL
jgi:hypothetical protein